MFSKNRYENCLFRATQNGSFQSHNTRNNLYLLDFSLVFTIEIFTRQCSNLRLCFRARRMGLAGHCARHPELAASNLILWEPKHGTRSRGRPATTYIDTLRRDTGLSNTGEIRALMINSDLWRAAIRDSRVGVG